MSYLVLARKWRPQSFEDIAGQGHITRTLQNAIRTKRIAHAYLFTGVRGVGKTTAARIVAKALNCEKGPTPTPCNECSHCQEITNGSSIDVLEIDGASNRGIDEIRQIIEHVRYQPAKCRFKIYIIDEVHQVTKDAFNALLKTLEEPPPSVKFILATTEPHRLPETILSRCQRFDFRRIALREIVQRLDDIAKKEGLKITPGALVLLAREADGSMRDAQSLLEQVLACAAPGNETSGAPAVDESLLQDLLGLAQRQLLYDLSAGVFRGDAKRCVEIIAEAAAQGRDLGRLSRDLVEHFRNFMVARLSAEKAAATASLLDLPDQEIADLVAQAQELSLETLLDYFDFMASGDEEVARSANPRFALETALIRLATLPKTLPVSELLERLEKLEGRFSGTARPAATRPKETAAPVQPAAAPSAKFEAGISGDPSTQAPAMAGGHALGIPPENRGPVLSKRSESKGVESGASGLPGGLHNDGAWQGFVAFVGREKKFLASHLLPCTVLELAPGQLKIGVTERHHMNYLLDADNFSALKSLAKQFFSPDMSLTLTPLAVDAEAKTGDIARGAPASQGEERSEMVKEALRIFGGSVRSERKESV
ncbi:MAG: DNA polymerase III subunit gamma/tau [Deltaproteobacteria bacterium]|nr:DNA polymerase III subunit gamma/tau [Deltaproteobacteria bacterium]